MGMAPPPGGGPRDACGVLEDGTHGQPDPLGPCGPKGDSPKKRKSRAFPADDSALLPCSFEPY